MAAVFLAAFFEGVGFVAAFTALVAGLDPFCAAFLDGGAGGLAAAPRGAAGCPAPLFRRGVFFTEVFGAGFATVAVCRVLLAETLVALSFCEVADVFVTSLAAGLEEEEDFGDTFTTGLERLVERETVCLTATLPEALLLLCEEFSRGASSFPGDFRTRTGFAGDAPWLAGGVGVRVGVLAEVGAVGLVLAFFKSALDGA
ncbi:MAG: hypothetical protein LC114_12825 [Bryobacterales bacterium]|nr:hypothetical protein [Bryobacterales bacterium]